jgi:hypothetical protein
MTTKKQSNTTNKIITNNDVSASSSSLQSTKNDSITVAITGGAETITHNTVSKDEECGVAAATSTSEGRKTAHTTVKGHRHNKEGGFFNPPEEDAWPLYKRRPLPIGSGLICGSIDADGVRRSARVRLGKPRKHRPGFAPRKCFATRAQRIPVAGEVTVD